MCGREMLDLLNYHIPLNEWIEFQFKLKIMGGYREK